MRTTLGIIKADIGSVGGHPDPRGPKENEPKRLVTIKILVSFHRVVKRIMEVRFKDERRIVTVKFLVSFKKVVERIMEVQFENERRAHENHTQYHQG